MGTLHYLYYIQLARYSQSAYASTITDYVVRMQTEHFK